MRNVGLIYLARVKFLQRGKVKTFTEYKFVKKTSQILATLLNV